MIIINKQYLFKILSVCLFSILFFNIGNAKNHSPEIKVEAFVSKSIALIGDHIDYHLIIKTDSSLKIKVEDINIFDDYEIINVGSLEEIIKKGIKTTSLSYKFSILKAGDYILPSLSIQYGRDSLNKVIKSGQVPLSINTLLNKDENDIRDIVPPLTIKISSDFKNYIFVVLAIVLLIVLIIFIKKRKKTKLRTVEISKPAWEIAFGELDALAQKDFLQQEKFKEFYYELSFILRNYIENRFQVMAPERTTEEFIKIMQSQNIFTKHHQKLLKEFLLASDLIKFAKKRPESKEIDEGSVLIRTFVEDTMVKDALKEDKI